MSTQTLLDDQTPSNAATTASLHRLTLPGPMLQRGFWLYVWRVETPKGERLYVGRTGDSSSPHATAPYTRMGQHLGFSKAQNSLRRLLSEAGVEPEPILRGAVAHLQVSPGLARQGLRDQSRGAGLGEILSQLV